eukprot:SAG31_NODE_40944_length_278_cov_0.865922_1_plen_38_part_01
MRPVRCHFISQSAGLQWKMCTMDGVCAGHLIVEAIVQQ